MNTIDMLTVYLGSSGHTRPVFKEAAQRLGALIGAHGKSLVYGGMDAGLMGIMAISALESGAHVTGIIPEKLLDIEREMAGLSEKIIVGDLCERKKRMFLMADAVVTLPGGFGTLDEALEVLYWGHLGLHNKPSVLVNIEGYWDDLIRYIMPLPDFDERFLLVVDTVEAVFPALERFVPLPEAVTPPHLPHFEDEIMRATAQPIMIDRATLENTYFAICALGLKQLGQHGRPIGFLNEDGIFDGLLRWIDRAAQEHFITPKCLKLFDSAADEKTLRGLLKSQGSVTIDLHHEKWGERT